ncbi:hypothetical protein NX059_009904 [Plenodomus lindquistii]|nr:hypothetical protein NX059_009904 [Plenodomus lindquistii]
MKLPLLPTLFFLTTFAHPSPPPISTLDPSNPPQNTTLTPRAPYGAITLTMSSTRLNYGGTPYAHIYNNIYRAIRSSCPFASYNSQCKSRFHAVHGKIKTRVHSAPGVAPFTVDILLTIDSASWNGNEALYKLMVGSLAGAVERGTYDARNCESFVEFEGGVKKGFTFCNSMASVRIDVPGGGGEHMAISMESVKGRGEWVCDGSTGTVTQYVEGLKGEFEKALGVKKSSDLYVYTKCKY